MALKAYKHLTDGQVKLVEAGSAEETALVADTVQGFSYPQLVTAGKSQEIAAVQGDPLWEDVTGELGGGSAFVHFTEDTGSSRELISHGWSIGWDDLWLQRNTAGGSLGIADPNEGGVYISPDGTDAGSYVLFDGTNGQVGLTNGTQLVNLFPGTASSRLFIGGNGGGLQVLSPDGTRYNVTVANGGTLSIVAA
jgi:hypothetical protein